MDIAEIATSDYIEVDTGERLAKVRSIFERKNPRGIIVTDDRGLIETFNPAAERILGYQEAPARPVPRQ